MVIDSLELCIVILVWLTLTFIQGHRSVRKQKLLRQLSHNVFMNLILILSHLCSILRREPYVYDLVKINLNAGLYSDSYWPVSLERVMMIGITKLYILTSL